MPFGRTARQNNRSQHALVESQSSGGAGTGSPRPLSIVPTAIPSLSQQQLQQQQPPPQQQQAQAQPQGQSQSQSQSQQDQAQFRPTAAQQQPRQQQQPAITPTVADAAPQLVTNNNPSSASPANLGRSESFDLRANQPPQFTGPPATLQQLQQQHYQLLHNQQHQSPVQPSPLTPAHGVPVPVILSSNNGYQRRPSGSSRLVQQQLPQQPANGAHVAFDPRRSLSSQQQTQQQQAQAQQARGPQLHDFAEQVARSQSQRFSQLNPLQAQHHFHTVGSSSVEELSSTLNLVSPVAPRLAPAFPPQQQPPQVQAPPPEPKRSTRRLLKNILTGSSGSARGSDPHHHAAQNSFDHSASLPRRPSKRGSNPQPAPIRTGTSQISLETSPQAVDWQAQSAAATHPSPLQGVGEHQDSYSVPDPNPKGPLPDIQKFQQSTIRPVPHETDTASLSPDDIAAYHQQQAQAHLSSGTSPDIQQQPQFGQVNYGQHLPHGQHIQYHVGGQPSFVQHLTAPPENADSVSQISHESPINDLEQHSAYPQSGRDSSPAARFPTQIQDLQQDEGAGQGQQTMAGGPSARRSQEAEKGTRGQAEQPPPGPPPTYRQSQSNMNPLPPPPNAQGSNREFRQSTLQERQPPQFEGSGSEQAGRGSPQPSAGDREDSEKAFKDLLTKYKNVKRLYFDGKGQIEVLNGQVEQLQNAIANQRMSESRTSWDDNEYSTRFTRLNGAITNLAFNVRKDWVNVPPWLSGQVSKDALKTGKQEMTAVGRAMITRWIVEEIFHRCFHPGLDPELSLQLKEIEHNIRRFSYTRNSQEEHDALTSKVISWRMTTLEGLRTALSSPESQGYRDSFTERSAANLATVLLAHLSDPPPAGVEGSAMMIVELAVAIASNVPMESRDVAITFPLPGDSLNPNLMDVEKTVLPALERPSDHSEDDDSEEDTGEGSSGEKEKRSAPKDTSNNIRFAGFVAVEVRGRQVLIKAPVWSI